MFEIGFSELMMVGLVSLIVIGPERLPKAARLAGFWLGKSRAMVASVKAEIAQELYAEELRQLFHEQSGLQEISELYHETADEFHGMQSSLAELAAPAPAAEAPKPAAD